MEDSILSRETLKLDAELVNTFREQNLPGMSVGIVDDQRLVWSKGYGWADIQRQLKADEKSIYHIASVAKMFNATMLMQLRDAGKLCLDDPIVRYLPEFKLKSRFIDPREPTFRQVVAHAAGLPMDYGFDMSVPGEWRQFPVATILADLSTIDLAQPAFLHIHYSNLGICLMGQALQRIADLPYREYVKSHIFQPLGMKNTAWTLTDEMAASLAIGYERQIGDRPRETSALWVTGDFGPPAGGVHSSVEDMAKFIALQFREGTANGAQILGSTTLREMRAPIFLADDWSMAYGIGWELERLANHAVVGHGGGGLGFVAEIKLVPDLRFGIVILINQVTDQHAIARQAVLSLIPAFEEIREKQRPTSRRLLPAEVQDYLGWYSGALGYSVRIQLRGDKLSMVAVDKDGGRGSEWVLAPAEAGSFIIESGSDVYDGERISFRRNNENGVMQLQWQRFLLDKTT